jgi:ATP-dependent Lon protease
MNKNIKIKNDGGKEISIKIKKYLKIITETSIYVQRHKLYDVIGSKELNLCITRLELLMEKLLKIKKLHDCKSPNILNLLEEIKMELLLILKSFGTRNIENILDLMWGEKYSKKFKNNEKMLLLSSYIYPIGYKIMNWRKETKNSKNNVIAKNRIVEDFMIIDRAESMDCYDLSRTSTNFQTKVYGIKIAFQNEEEKKTLIICGLCESIVSQCIENNFINDRYKGIYLSKPKEPDFNRQEFDNFMNTLSIKDYLIYSNDEIYNKYVGYINQLELIKKKTISQVVKEYLANNLFQQRQMLMQLLINNDNSEFQYLAYLLYDLLSSDNNGAIDSYDQTLLFDSLPWYTKKFFSVAMDKTMNYTKSLSNFDTSKIPLEQQICLLKASENVKEKAMIKLKEVKAKSEDSGSKARQYLEGLLKIPFGIFKNENILKIMKEIESHYKNLISKSEFKNNIKTKSVYSILDINKGINEIENNYMKKLEKKNMELIINFYSTGKREYLIANICFLNSLIKKSGKKIQKLRHSGKKNSEMKEYIRNFLGKYVNDFPELSDKVYKKIETENIIDLKDQTKIIKNKITKMEKNIASIKDCLNKSVHGHKNAKRQVERIIGQWISGKQKGYCFGFEGPPGVGKTSLAKNGLSECLKDEEGNPRPFSFIALGGSCNGSTISGHNYTYVGSTWGKIVDILIEKKCMNPIIFIDELDKVSKTEHGKEIIGILTHLIDPTQNEKFEDKYFSGVGLDLSNVLFIFSYNDVNAIDRILLDRIHRIKFDSLSLEEKIEISNKFLLPEIYQNMNMENVVILKDKILEYIINNYTKEAGVRKLKEILFEIISEINLELLENKEDLTLPVVVTQEMIKMKYLKDRVEVKYNIIHSKKEVGIINGLWANSMGMGGIIQIECKFYPTPTFFDLKLTGMQGDVMKESMNVAKTLAWNLCSVSEQNKLTKQMEKTKLQGIHIHCPEGAVPKDGPSAGTAITMAIYSLLTKKSISNKVAITGETNLYGKVTQIGGLELKIMGGVRAGVEKFLFPKENESDFLKIMNKEVNKKKYKNIEFKMMENVDDVVSELFVKI